MSSEKQNHGADVGKEEALMAVLGSAKTVREEGSVGGRECGDLEATGVGYKAWFPRALHWALIEQPPLPLLAHPFWKT